MGNCLKTQLKEAVQNEHLTKMDELLLHVKTTDGVDYNGINSLQLACINGNITMRVVGNGYFARSAAELDTNPLTEITITPSDGVVTLAMANANYDIIISNKQNLIQVGPAYAYDQPAVNIGYIDLKYVPYLTNVKLQGQKTDLHTLKDSIWLPYLNSIEGYRSSYSGDIAEDFGSSLNCFSFDFNDSRANGTLESLLEALKGNGCNGETNMYFQRTNVTYQNAPVSSNYNVKFGTSMVNPTAEDTARGYQIAEM